MIKRAIENWDERKTNIEGLFREKHPGEYKEIIKNVISVITDDDEWGEFNPDPERIHLIDDGDYQGTLLFVIGAKGYQPSDYWYVKVGYGSCSACDTLQSIHDYSHEKPDDKQIKQYMTLALHVVQGLKKMGEDII